MSGSQLIQLVISNITVQIVLHCFCINKMTSQMTEKSPFSEINISFQKKGHAGHLS